MRFLLVAGLLIGCEPQSSLVEEPIYISCDEQIWAATQTLKEQYAKIVWKYQKRLKACENRK